MPKFSIIIPVYNKEKYIFKTLTSVINQRVSDFEIIIINDASSDDSRNVIKGFDDKRITYFELEENKGAAAARNFGIEKAQGTYISFLDADDIWVEDFLSEVEVLITKFPYLNVYATAVTRELKEKRNPFSYELVSDKKNSLLDLEYFANSTKDSILHTSAVVLHKLVLEEVGVFDPTIKSGQDTDLWIRVGLKYRIGFCSTPLVIYKHIQDSLYNSTKSVTHKPDFLNYLELEKKKPALKKFIDLNRYSLILRARLWNEPKEVAKYLDNLDAENLNSKQRFLLRLPTPMLKLAFKTQAILEKLGFKVSAF